MAGSKKFGSPPASSDLQPFEQGALDYLCSVYAVTNGLRLLLAERHPLTTSQSARLFRAGIRYLAQEDKLASALNNGVSVVVFWKLTRVLAEKVSKMIKLPIHVTGLKQRRGESSQPSLAQILGEGCDPGVPLILLGGAYDHFTVVRAVTEKRLMLFDSYGFQYVSLDLCNTEPGGARHHVPLGAVVVLTLDDDRRAVGNGI